MKRLRRLAVVLAGFLLLLSVAGLYVRHRVKEIPEWYHPFDLDAATQRTAANAVDWTLVPLHSAATAPPKANAVIEPFSHSDLELSAWAFKWEASRLHWRNLLGSRLADPIILFPGKEIVLAARVTDWDVIASLHFEPRLENGKLHLGLERVMAGTLPVPRWMWSSYVEKIVAGAEKKLPAQQREAEIDPRGRANSAASDAGMALLLIHVLRGEPSEPVLFIPDPQHGGRSAVVQITRIDISDHCLTLQLGPMNADQREAYLQQIRGPEQASIGLGK